MRSHPTVAGVVRMIFLEYGYDSWLCGALLFNLRMAISGLFVRGGCTEERERVPCRIAQPASCDSGAVCGSVWYVGDFYRS